MWRIVHDDPGFKTYRRRTLRQALKPMDRVKRQQQSLKMLKKFKKKEARDRDPPCG